MVNRSDPHEIGSTIWEALDRRVDYISDPEHENHIGKVVLPARNYNCGGQTKEDFMNRVETLDANYYAYRDGLKGPKVDRIWNEIIYSSQPGAYLTDEERDAIERKIIGMFGPRAAVRTAWHISPDGRADLHVLMSEKQPTAHDPDAYEPIFGRAIGNEIAVSIATDRSIARYLNANPDKHIVHTAAYDIHLALNPPLAVKIANEYPNTKITAGNIAECLIKLGHTFVGITKRSLTLIYNGATNATTRPLQDLLTAIAQAQARLFHSKSTKLKTPAKKSAKTRTPAKKSTKIKTPPVTPPAPPDL